MFNRYLFCCEGNSYLLVVTIILVLFALTPSLRCQVGGKWLWKWCVYVFDGRPLKSRSAARRRCRLRRNRWKRWSDRWLPRTISRSPTSWSIFSRDRPLLHQAPASGQNSRRRKTSWLKGLTQCPSCFHWSILEASDWMHSVGVNCASLEISRVLTCFLCVLLLEADIKHYWVKIMTHYKVFFQK